MTITKFVPKLVTACCVLHNLCEQYEDAREEEWIVHPRGIDDRAQVPSAKCQVPHLQYLCQQALQPGYMKHYVTYFFSYGN